MRFVKVKYDDYNGQFSSTDDYDRDPGEGITYLISDSSLEDFLLADEVEDIEEEFDPAELAGTRLRR